MLHLSSPAKGRFLSARRERVGGRGVSGFTLIELLVVIGIITLLLGILLPVMSRAREQGKRTACLANLQTLARACIMYAQEHAGRLPNGNPPGTLLDPPGAATVLKALNERYVKSPASFHCPSDKDDVPKVLDNAEYDIENSARVSYDFFSLFWLPEEGPKLGRIKDAPLVWDLNGGSGISPIINHRRGGNVVFADGHAIWQRGDEWDGSNWPHPADLRYR